MALAFRKLRDQNVSRAARWHDGAEPWTLGDWGNAMAGEAGEACNVIKKIRRLETGTDVARETERELNPLRAKLAKELADVVIYADLIAAQIRVSLEEAIALKFNEVSKQYGFPERL